MLLRILSCTALLAVLSGSSLAAAPALRVLVVTGGHDYPTSFYTLFEQAGIAWDHAVNNEKAFERDLRERYDVVVLYDMSKDLGPEGRRHFQDFAESGKGIVVLHHAIVSYRDWPWYRDLVGGRYLEQPQANQPASTYQHDVDMRLQMATPHPVTRGLALHAIHDETYKGMWIAPTNTILVTTDHPLADPPVAWVSAYARSRVVYIQLGHGAEAHRDAGYRALVRQAIEWSASRNAGP